MSTLTKRTKVSYLRKYPAVFRCLTDLTPDKFDQVFNKLKPIYEEAEYNSFIVPIANELLVGVMLTS